MRARRLVVSCGAAFVCLAFVVTGADVSAQTRVTQPPPSEAARMPADVRAAYEFLFAAYPELVGRPLEIQIRPADGELLVSLAEVPPGQRVDAAPAPVLVRARITFDNRGQLEKYSADGPYLSDTDNVLFREALRSNPGWSAAQADAELARMRASTRAAQGFQPASGEAFDRQLGAGVAKGTAVMQWRDVKDGAPPGGFIRPFWVVEASATSADGSAQIYRMEYEPVTGRLVGVTRQGGAR